MSLISAIQISVTLSRKRLFEDVGFQVSHGERLGLIGPNGSGKTTLLRLLNKEMLPDEGEVRVKKGARTGYLPQDIQESLTGPLLQSILHTVPRRLDLENELKKTEQDLTRENDEQLQTRLAEKLTELHHEAQRMEQAFPPHKAEKILTGLGFREADFTMQVSALSGGWKTRAALAGLLYQNPDILLLDEPTNHLDLPSVHWLEQFLEQYRGALVLISHDREFLNRQVDRIISLEPEGVRFYRGNYDAYLVAREEEKKILEAKARNQEIKIKEAQKFITRFRAKASKARQVQSKIKLSQKIEMVKTRKKEKTIHFQFPEVPRSGREVLSIDGIAKSFGDNTLYEGLNLHVLRDQRIAIVGPNGCGKTTLLRIIAREIPADSGEIKLGHNVRLQYYAQHHSDMLDPQKTVIDEVYQTVPHETVAFVRGVCGAFLFSGQDVDKPVGVLSGGEKARVSLARLLVNPGNFMIMDEPTNHLDIASSEMLINALEEYQGTILFVSHNQSFINRLATKIWDIREKAVLEFPGNLEEYYLQSEKEKETRKTAGLLSQNDVNSGSDDLAAPLPPSAEKSKVSRKGLKKEQAEKRRLIYETLKPIMSRLEKTEQDIALLEKKHAELEKTLEEPDLFKDEKKSVPLVKAYQEVKEQLDRMLDQWEQAQNNLETVKKELGLQSDGNNHE